MTDLEKPDPAAEKAERVQALSRALVFALVSAVPDQPYAIPMPVAVAAASILDDCGVRQTAERSVDIELPTWITQRAREEAAPVPTAPDVHAIQETTRVRKAPPRPAKIPKKLLGVVH